MPIASPAENKNGGVIQLTRFLTRRNSCGGVDSSSSPGAIQQLPEYLCRRASRPEHQLPLCARQDTPAAHVVRRLGRGSLSRTRTHHRLTKRATDRDQVLGRSPSLECLTSIFWLHPQSRRRNASHRT